MPDSADLSKSSHRRTIVLVGMMGAGKTTLGRRLAPRLDLPFFDADEEIERAAGMPVSELFERHGERSFREGEARVLKRLLEGPPHVLATGGGAVVYEETRRLIKQHAVSVWIRANVETLARRATRRDTRPLLRNGNPEEILRNLAKEREAFYAQADIHIDSQPGPHEATIDTILDALSTWQKSSPNSEKAPSP
ncbi:MAG: shikimate kinase [Pseudomonadota bacterium]